MTNLRRAVVALALMGGLYAAGSTTGGASPQPDPGPRVVEHHEGHYVIEGLTECVEESDCAPAWDGENWSIQYLPN